MARSREVRKLDQNRATSSTDKGTMFRLGTLDAQPAHRKARSADAHRPRGAGTSDESPGDLTGSVGKRIAQGAIDDGNALVDGGAGRSRCWPDWNRT